MNNLDEQNKAEITEEVDHMERELRRELSAPAELSETPAESGTEDVTESKEKKDTLSEVLEWVRFTIVVVLLGLLLTNYVIQRNTVQGDSMFPTLLDGDELLVEKVSRYFGAIHRGDIITVNTKGVDAISPNNVIKRVIGLPGEEVEIKDGHVYINGEKLDEPYLKATVITNGDIRHPENLKVKLAENEYYCLGDNRPNSKDSRVFGPIPRQNILGHSVVRIYPFDRFGTP